MLSLFHGPAGRRLSCVDVLTVATAPAVAYLIIAALVAVDSILPAIPSEVLVVAAGALAASGELIAGWAVAAAAVGAFVGDHVVYRLGRHGISGVLARSRMGQRVSRTVERVHDRFQAASGIAIVVARFMPFGRTMVAGTAGLAGVHPSKFSAFSAVGVLLWAAWLTGLGFLTGQQTGGPSWISVAIGSAIALAIGAGITMLKARWRRNTSMARNMSAADVRGAASQARR